MEFNAENKKLLIIHPLIAHLGIQIASPIQIKKTKKALNLELNQKSPLVNLRNLSQIFNSHLKSFQKALKD